jgi:cyclopropane fatty-acyl-phospholipid synthase-like methyltransferase
VAHRTYVDRRFKSSAAYWEKRYIGGGNSGASSYGRLAIAKANILNQLVEVQEIESVLELGCGDGSLLALAKYPSYAGVDVSMTAIETCRKRFSGDSSKRFSLQIPNRSPLANWGFPLMSFTI